MKKHLLAIALFALCTTGLNAASPKKVAPEKKGVETINRATAEAHIGFLACDELEGREAGWKGGRIAGNYIISCLKQMGIKPLDGDYIQPFDVYHAERQVKGKRWQVHPDSIAELKKVVHQKLTLRNILGKIEGKNPNEIVIIGAHYDHIGYDPMLDAGAGASTKVVLPYEIPAPGSKNGRMTNLIRIENVRDVGEYISRIDEMIERKGEWLWH